MLLVPFEFGRCGIPSRQCDKGRGPMSLYIEARLLRRREERSPEHPCEATHHCTSSSTNLLMRQSTKSRSRVLRFAVAQTWVNPRVLIHFPSIVRVRRARLSRWELEGGAVEIFAHAPEFEPLWVLRSPKSDRYELI